MKYLTFSIMLYILLFNCGSDVDVQTMEIQPLTNVLKLELSFGDEKTVVKDEFLLVKPRYTVIGGTGDIYILDEDRIKVYDEKGIPKTIIGRPGKGPGEFDNPKNPMVSEDGLITVIDDKGANLFSAEFDYLTTHYIRYNTKYDELLDKNGWKSMELDRAICITEDERIIATQTLPLEPDSYYIYHNVLLYEKGDSVYNVETYHSEYSFRAGVMSGGFTHKGRFQWDMLPKRRIVYSDPGNDYSFENSEWTYTLHIFSLDTYERRSIHRKYEPLELTEKWKSDEISQFDDYPEEIFSRMREYIEFYKSVFENAKYYDPFRKILTDRNYIFVFTFRWDEEQGIFTDIIDADSGEHLSSAYFDRIPDQIKNGYAYYIMNSGSRDKFPLIEKYKIDPAVYGK